MSSHNLHYSTLELGWFTHRTSNIGNIGAKLNIGESVVSVCRYVIVTRWHTFNKPHTHCPHQYCMVASPWQLAGCQCENVVTQCLLWWSNVLCTRHVMPQCLIAVTSIGNKTKHTYAVQKLIQNSKLQTSVSVLDIKFFSPKYRNIGHRKFYENRLTLMTTAPFSEGRYIHTLNHLKKRINSGVNT